jgi:glycine/serine hydroxymethyltransferase
MFEILFGVALIVLASKTAPALAAKISGGGAGRDTERKVQALADRLHQTEEKVMTMMSDNHERMVDIEERLDFAERLLQQQRAQGKLGRGD